jgi:predicted secreted protein
MLNKLIEYIILKDYGIIQLPCPELEMYGIKRWGHVKNQFDNEYFRGQCNKMLENYIKQFKEYFSNGYEIRCIIGVEKSPSCGVKKTCISSSWGGTINNKCIKEKIDNIKIVNKSGVFIEELEKMLRNKDLDIPLIGIDEEDVDKSLNNIKKILN